MSSSPGEIGSAAASDILGSLLDEITRRAQKGEPIDLEQYLKEYPNYDAELRKLLPTISVLLDMANPSHAQNQPSGTRSESNDEPAKGVIGDYQIIQEIGRGGMGVVYEAEQLSLRRRVALKVLPFAAMLDKRQMARFQNEAHAAASLTHQHIVPVYAFGCERGVHYYAMQFVEGHPLDRVISELRGRSESVNGDKTSLAQISQILSGQQVPSEHEAKYLSPDPSDITAPHDYQTSSSSTVQLAALSTEQPSQRRQFFRSVAEIGIQASEALEYAHQHGVIHRDIKPPNLMLDEACNLWLTDFGLARIEANPGMTMTGDLIGTLRYMSPEQALAKRVVIDHRTDIYSLGATLYELLTLRPVIEGSDHQELLKRIAFEDPIPPRRHDESIPVDLETILLTSLAKNPEERYSSARDLAEDLRRYLNHETIRAKRATLWQHVQKWSARHRSLVWTMGGVFGVDASPQRHWPCSKQLDG